MNLNFPDLINFLLSISIWTVVKVMFCFAIFIYIIFAFVIIRQVALMTEALNGQLDSFLKFVSWAHFLVAVFILLFAILFL